MISTSLNSSEERGSGRMGKGKGEREREQVKRLMILLSGHLRGWSRCRPLSLFFYLFHLPINSPLDLLIRFIDCLLLPMDKRITCVRPLELTFALSLFYPLHLCCYRYSLSFYTLPAGIIYNLSHVDIIYLFFLVIFTLWSFATLFFVSTGWRRVVRVLVPFVVIIREAVELSLEEEYRRFTLDPIFLLVSLLSFTSFHSNGPIETWE